VLAWDPERCRLEAHVFDGIRFRTRHHRERARRFPHISLESCDEGTHSAIEDALRAEAETQTPEEAHRSARCLASIHDAARDDQDVKALLDAYRRAETKADVIRVTGMSDRQYDNARKRLRRLVHTQRALESQR